jgi:two-component system osmolarity sensor histidine kinase EnvZ
MRGQDISLARQYALLLAAFFVAFELLMAAAVVGLLMMPMARRAAGDLAGLMVLSAQTWSELPPETRPAFEVELANNHVLALRADMPAEGQDPIHGPYLYFLEEALAEKTGDRLHLVTEVIDGQTWYWVSLPSGDGRIAVGLPHDRIGTQPLNTMVVSLVGALAMALIAAAWLARRAVGPLARLEQAAARVGRGEVPELLPETGPRELATLARRFNAMARQVRELLAARTTLLAGVSHDLRTPLARMRVALALLEKRPTPKLYARLEADIEEMDRLIGNVLDLARGLASEATVDVDLRALLHELAGSDGRVAVSSPDLRVEVAPLALRRAIGNLIDNARRYGGVAAIDVVAEARAGEVRIGVLDRGPGIPEHQLAAVFEPFHRLDAARSPAIGGAGLGLAIVRQLADANHWQVALTPREGGGLAAWLTLRMGSRPTQDS